MCDRFAAGEGSVSPQKNRRVYRWTDCRADTSESEEFRYLAKFVDRQIALATPEAEIVGAEALCEAGEEDLVVRLASDRTLFTAASLRAMRAAIDHGAEVVLATAFHEVAGPAATTVHTLAGYQAVEARALRVHSDGHDPTPMSCPSLSLWRAATFQAAGAGDRGVSVPAGVRVARAGVFYEFIDYYGEVRADVLPYLSQGCRDVLEVGCARGLTGALIHEALGCRVTGVDLNPVIAEEARNRLHAVHCGDIEELELAEQFDAVVALELFEHLRDPMAFVARMLDYLRPGGRIVMSTPNVGHYSIVSDLIRGRWDYVPIGLLCYTHLRFFTKSTLEDWLAMAGCGVVEVIPQRTALPDSVARWARSVPDADLDSLATKGFWVVASR